MGGGDYLPKGDPFARLSLLVYKKKPHTVCILANKLLVDCVAFS